MEKSTPLLQFSRLSRIVFRLFGACLLIGAGACGAPWAPTGGWQGAVVAECESFDLERRLSEMSDGEAQVSLVKSYFNHCGAQLSENASSHSLVQLSRLATIEYDYQRLRMARALTFSAADGLKVKGTLFMQPGKDKRPLVIVKCGVQCEDGSTTLRHLLMNLFDEGPFHVLLVPSFTGSMFQRENGILPIGGFDEGRQVLKLAKWLQSAGFKESGRVGEVHVLGVSLGGHTALYSAIYGGHQRLADGRPVIASVFAGCPAVDLEESVSSLFNRSSGLVGKVFSKRFWDQMFEIAKFVPILNFLTIGHHRRSVKEISPLIEDGALDYYTRATARSDFFEAPLKGIRIRDRESLWAANRFQNYAHLVKIPVYVWAAQDDCVVGTASNALALERMRIPNIHTLITERGNHCVFSDAYTWRSTGAVIRGMLMANSPSLRGHRATQTQRLQITKVQHLDRRNDWIGADAKRKRRVLQWRAVAGAAELDLIFYGKRRCAGIQDASKCERGYSVAKVPLATVGLQVQDRPRDAIAAQALTRWLNANAWVWGARRGRLDPSESPVQVEAVHFTASATP